jgi:hypothetical protein
VIGKSAAGFSLRVEMEGRFSDLTGSEAAFQASSLTLDSSPGMSRALPPLLVWSRCKVDHSAGTSQWEWRGRRRLNGEEPEGRRDVPSRLSAPLALVASRGLLWPRSGKRRWRGLLCVAAASLAALLAALAAKQPHHFSQACSLHLHLPLPPLPRPFRTRPPSFLHSLPLSFFPSLIQHPSFNTTLSTLINVDDLIPSFNTPLGDVLSAT